MPIAVKIGLMGIVRIPIIHFKCIICGGGALKTLNFG